MNSLTLCISLLVCNVTQQPPQMPIDSLRLSGNLSEYAPGVMERTIEHQLKHGVISQSNVDTADYFMAVFHCHHRNKFATITYQGIDYRVLIVDCANLSHPTTREFFNRGIVGEVGHRFSSDQNLQMNGRYAKVVIDG